MTTMGSGMCKVMVYLASACTRRSPSIALLNGDSLQDLTVSRCLTDDVPPTYDANVEDAARLPLCPLLPASSSPILHSPVLEVAKLPLGSGIDTLVPRNVRHNLSRSILDVPSECGVLQMLRLFHNRADLPLAEFPSCLDAQLTAKFSGTLFSFMPPFMNLFGSNVFASDRAW